MNKPDETPDGNAGEPVVSDDAGQPVVSEARLKFEEARLTRRRALKKIGLTAGASLLLLFSVDDLARLTATKLKEHRVTEAIGNNLAKEFSNSGIAQAQEDPCGCNGDCTCICQCNFTTTIAQMCAAAPACCTNGVPNGNILCPFFNADVAAAKILETECVAGCD